MLIYFLHLLSFLTNDGFIKNGDDSYIKEKNFMEEDYIKSKKINKKLYYEKPIKNLRKNTCNGLIFQPKRKN